MEHEWLDAIRQTEIKPASLKYVREFFFCARRVPFQLSDFRFKTGDTYGWGA